MDRKVAVAPLFQFCSLLLFGAFSGCDEIADRYSSISFVDVAPDHAKLINGIESYQSIEAAKKKFPVWEVIEQSSLGPKDQRPPFNIYKVAIKNYSHLGISGELHLGFFNDRLMETWFYPDSFDKYFEVLKEKGGLAFQESRWGKESQILPYTRVWVYKDYKDRNYVGWEDTRLGRESAIWIQRYS